MILHIVHGMIHSAMPGVVILILFRMPGMVLHVVLFVFVQLYLANSGSRSGLGHIIIQRMPKPSLQSLLHLQAGARHTTFNSSHRNL